jgi:MEDS: MEthanogen/methylotroph, DcmR Sensory domain
MVKPVVEGYVNDILQEIMQVDYGQHNLLIYSDLIALNEIYSRYFKTRLEGNEEIIHFLSTYQTIDNVRDLLRDADVEVARYEGDGSLVIVDCVKGYFGSETDVLCLIKILSKCAQNQGMSGCSVFADMGSFYVGGKVRELLEYEASMPLKFDRYHVGGSLIKCKAFCMYHEKDFNRLTEDEKQSLFQQHYRNLIVSGRQTDWRNT